MPYTERIIRELRRKNYTPATPEDLAEKLDIPEGELDAFEANLQALEYQGRVARLKGRRYTLAKRANLVIGNLDVAKAGFGFVVPLDRDRNRHDIYIARRDMGSATDGDLVAARITKRKGRFGQPSGRVEYVVKRHRVNFVGTYQAHDGGGRVLVDGSSAIREIKVPRLNRIRPETGEKVVVEVKSWPRAGGTPSGALVEVLGPAADPTTDTLAVIREFDLPEEFSEATMREAQNAPESVGEKDLKGRLDLRDRTVITIDPVHARDFDDAISIKRTADGWLLGVHIADVSEYARVGSALDEEAARRATSVYLPTKVIPMLPHAISNGIASLRENEDRLTKTVILRYNRRGQLLGYEIHKSVIRSSKRMTYQQACDVLAGREPEGVELSGEIRDLLGEAAELARILERRRIEAGMLELDMPEVELEIGGDGEVTAIRPVIYDASHKLIEMFMVAANEAVAEFMTARNLPHLRRIHEEPSADALQALKVFLASMGFVIRDVRDRRQLQDILKRARGRPESPVVNLAILKSMQRAQYSPERKGHYALASSHYSHYTSPIRRYPDLVIHQILDEYLTGAMDKSRRRRWEARLPQIAVQSSELSRRAEAAERELTKLKTLRYLEKHAGGEYEGIITGVKPFGIFVELSGYVIDGFVHVSALADGNMRFDERGRRLTSGKKGGSFRLGDPVIVSIKAIDLSSRTLDLELVRKVARRA